jgi:hypothetical protein
MEIGNALRAGQNKRIAEPPNFVERRCLAPNRRVLVCTAILFPAISRVIANHR